MSRRSEKEFYPRMNRVMEGLAKTYLSTNDNKYCWALFRNTFGYGEYEVKILGRKIAEKTGILEFNVSRTETRLKSRNIIHVYGKIKGFNWNIEQWKNLSLPIGFKNLSLPKEKLIATGKKNLSLPIYPLSTKERKLQRREDFYIKLSRKEIEKLESENWYRAVMWNYGKFGMEYIEKTIKDYNYNTRMSCWYIYEDSGNIRNKEAYFSHLLRNYKEEEN